MRVCITSWLSHHALDGDAQTDIEAKDPCIRMIAAGDGQLTGLPLVGFAEKKYVNGETVGTGVLANYAVANAHKGCRLGKGSAASEC